MSRRDSSKLEKLDLPNNASDRINRDCAGVVIYFELQSDIMQKKMSLPHIILILRQALPLLVERYRVKSLGVFGSYVRHSQRTDSDLDLLVTFLEPPSLLKFIELENYLSDFVGVKVDLVMEDALKPRIGRQVLTEVVHL
jgi:predicted nucleotidyltransferase